MKRKNLLLIAAIIIIIIVMIVKCNCKYESNEPVVIKKKVERFVNPPLPTADVPFTNYTVDATKGDTLLYPSGSIVLFPPNSFVDKNGKLIEGNVQVKYREFSHPIDYFLSGIPMGYDSAGTHYNFESAGMCDIQAFKDGQPVFVNKNAKPEINIETENKDLAQNLYYLDTASKQWVNKGKSTILTVGKKEVTVKQPDVASIPEPVKPSRVIDDLPIIKVTIDPESFKELLVYDNLQFQLDKDEQRFKPEDSYIRWDDIKLQKGKNYGLYIIRFSKSYAGYEKTVEYKVKPVLNDKDYAKAMLEYDKQMREYEKKIDARLTAEKANKQAYIRDSIKNAEIDRDNEKTARLNKIIEAKNAEIDKINAEVEAQNKKIEKENIRNKNISMNQYTLRSFEVDGFGIWNCDKPLLIDNYVKLLPVYLDENGDSINLYTANLYARNKNMIYQIWDNQVSVPLDQENMIVGIYEDRFAYITYDEFKKLNINSDTKVQHFPMHLVSKANNNYDFIKSLVDQ